MERKHYSIRFLLCLLLLIAVSLRASKLQAEEKIFVIKQSDGSLLFSSEPPKGGQNAEVFTAKGARYSYSSKGSIVLFRERFRDEIRAAAKRFEVEPALIRAVIHAESAFRSKAVSPKGALGLMQIMPMNLRRLGISKPFDPAQNIRGGTRFLSDLLSKYKGDLRLALAAYNAGEGAVERYSGVPPFTETQNYVRKVQRLYRRYQKSDK